MNIQWTNSRSLSATNLFFRRQLWIWPLAAACLLGLLAWWLRSSVEATLRESLAGQLQTVLDADVAAEVALWATVAPRYGLELLGPPLPLV